MNEEELEVDTLRSKKIQNGIQKRDPKGDPKWDTKKFMVTKRETMLLTVTSKFKIVEF